MASNFQQFFGSGQQFSGGGSSDPSDALNQIELTSAVDFTAGQNAYLNQDGNVYPYIKDQSPNFNVTLPVTGGNEGTFNAPGVMQKLSNGNVVFIDAAYTSPGNEVRFHIYDEDLNFIVKRTVSISNMAQGFIPSGYAERIIQDGSNADRIFIQTGDTATDQTRIWTFEYNPVGDLFSTPNSSGYLVATQAGTLPYFNNIVYDTDNNKVISVVDTGSLGNHTVYTLTYTGSGNFTQNGTTTIDFDVNNRSFFTAYYNNSIVSFWTGDSSSYARLSRCDWNGTSYSVNSNNTCDFRVQSGQVTFAKIAQDKLIVGVRTNENNFIDYNQGRSIPTGGYNIFSINNPLNGSSKTLQDILHLYSNTGQGTIPHLDNVTNKLYLAGINKLIEYDIDVSGNFITNNITDITRLVNEDDLDLDTQGYNVLSGVHKLGAKTYITYGNRNYQDNIPVSRFKLLDLDFLSLPYDAAPTGDSRLIGTYNATGVAGPANIDLLNEYKGEIKQSDTTGFNPGEIDNNGDLVIATNSVLSKIVPENVVNIVDTTVSFTFTGNFLEGRVATTGNELVINEDGTVSFGGQATNVDGYNTQGASDSFVFKLKSGRYFVMNNNYHSSYSFYYSILNPDFTTAVGPTTIQGGQWPDQRYYSGNKRLKHPDRDIFFYVAYNSGGNTHMNLRVGYRSNTSESFSSVSLMTVSKNSSIDGHAFIDFDIDYDNRCLVVYYSKRAYSELKVRTYDLDSLIMLGEVELTATGQSNAYMNIANMAIDQANKVAYTVITNGTTSNNDNVRMSKIAYDPTTKAYTDIIDQDLVDINSNMQNTSSSIRLHNFSIIAGNYMIFNILNSSGQVQFVVVNISGATLPTGSSNSAAYMDSSQMSTNARLVRPVYDESTNNLYYTDDGSATDNEVYFRNFNPSNGGIGSAQVLFNITEIESFFSSVNNVTSVTYSALNIVEGEFWVTGIENGSGSNNNNLLIGRGADSIGRTIAGTLLSAAAVENQPVSCLLSSPNRGTLIAKEAEATPGQKDINGLLVLTPSFSVISLEKKKKTYFMETRACSTSLTTFLSVSGFKGKVIAIGVRDRGNSTYVQQITQTVDNSPEEDIGASYLGVPSSSTQLIYGGLGSYTRGHTFSPANIGFDNALTLKARGSSNIELMAVIEVDEGVTL